MITHDARWSLSRGKNPVPSPWQATVLLLRITGFSPDSITEIAHL